MNPDILRFPSEYEAIQAFIEKGWTDGMPIIPPTKLRVDRFIDYCGRKPDENLGVEPVKGRTITVQKVAINSVMAGCLPEYFPIVLASIEAVLEPEFNLHAITASTMGAGVLSVVNGPIAKEVSINGSTSVFGPGHRSNATIGRAIRLCLINTTGSKSGEIDKATLGHPGKYTWCITENVESSPWSSLGEDRGVANDSSSVTLFAGLSPTQVSNHSSTDPKTILNSFRDALFAAGPSQGEIVITLCPEHAKHLSDAGWGKIQVKDYLYEIAVRKDDEWGLGSIPPGPKPQGKSNTHSTESPDSFTILVAGGNAGAFSNVIPLWGGGSNSRSVTKRISRV